MELTSTGETLSVHDCTFIIIRALCPQPPLSNPNRLATRCSQWGRTSLRIAAAKGHARIIQHLARQGADSSIPDWVRPHVRIACIAGMQRRGAAQH
eukprot:355066-Chlamydomonas_euryale.AAC.20